MILSVTNLAVRGRLRPVSLEAGAGETVGVVGSSGVGKTTLAHAILGLVAPDEGRIELDGRPRDEFTRAELAAKLQAVFQDPHSSLNPALTVGRIVGERIRTGVPEMLERVGLDPAAATRKPNAFSSGQRQRIAIARALIGHPELVVLDEPVSALDPSVQAQILNLLADLQAERGTSYLFISHDQDVVAHMADRTVRLA